MCYFIIFTKNLFIYFTSFTKKQEQYSYQKIELVSSFLLNEGPFVVVDHYRKYHNKPQCSLFVNRKHCFQFLLNWGHFNSQEKLKTRLMQNFGVTNREHYLAINEWGWVGYEELCRSRRVLWPRWITPSETCIILYIPRKPNSLSALLFHPNNS